MGGNINRHYGNFSDSDLRPQTVRFEKKNTYNRLLVLKNSQAISFECGGCFTNLMIVVSLMFTTSKLQCGKMCLLFFFFLEINKSMQANVSVTSHRDIYTTKGKQKEETRLYSDTSGGKCAPRGAPIAAYIVNMREICRHSRREITLIMLMLSVILRECSALYVRFSFFVA